MAKHTKTCPQCLDTFTSTRSDAKYCSQTCRSRYVKGTPQTRECVDCGVDISHRMGNAKFCAACYDGREDRRRHEQASEKACPVCGTLFRRARQKHCSRECGGVASRAEQLSREMTKTCAACDGVFHTRDKRVRHCSIACRLWTRNHPGVPRDLDRECAFCGTAFRANNARFRHCSSRCVRHAGKVRRRALMLEAFVEDVTVADLVARDGWVCGLCGDPVDMAHRHPHPRSLTIDHVVPLSRGGEHSIANTQIAHSVCNTRKGNRMEGPDGTGSQTGRWAGLEASQVLDSGRGPSQVGSQPDAIPHAAVPPRQVHAASCG